MFKLVVLSALLAFAAAAPGYLTGAHPAPVAYSSYAAPAVAYTSYAAPAVAYAAPAIAYAAPAVATAITKQVHYASHPVVTGYNAQVIKPNLGAIATPAEIVSQTKVLAPARSVQTITPQVTQIQPEVSIQKVAVDVPVQTPYVSHVEVRTPTVAAYPAPVAVKSFGYAAPAVAYGAVNTYGYAAPAVAYGAHVKSFAAPAVAYGAVNTYGYAAPAVAYGAHVKSFAAPALAYGAANYGYSGYGFAAPALAYGTHVKTVY